MENIIIFLKEKITELTDTPIDKINEDTPIENLDLVSLDYVSLQVDLKKEYNVDLDFNDMLSENVSSFGDLVAFINKRT